MGDLLGVLKGNPVSGIGLAGNPLSGIGMIKGMLGKGKEDEEGSGKSNLLSMLLGNLGSSVFGMGGLGNFIGGVPGFGGSGDG